MHVTVTVADEQVFTLTLPSKPPPLPLKKDFTARIEPVQGNPFDILLCPASPSGHKPGFLRSMLLDFEKKQNVFFRPPEGGTSPILSPKVIEQIEKANGRELVIAVFTLAVWAGSLYRWK
jgi:hypothetical protein